MRHTHRRSLLRLASAAVVPLLVLTVAACGPDDDSSSGSEDSSASSTPEGGAGTEENSAAPVGEDVDPKEFAKEIESSFDIDTAHTRMQIVNAGLVMVAEGDVDYTGDAPRMAMTMSAPAFGDEAIEARVIDGTMYMALPMLGAKTSDQFFELALDDPDNPVAKSLGGLSSFDPKATVEMFGQGVEKVTLVGDDSVNGVHTKHYVVTTNTDEFKRSVGQNADLVPETLDYDVWLDDDGRMAKMTADLNEEGGSMTLTMSKWGEPVTIKKPPANKVQDFPTESLSPSPSN